MCQQELMPMDAFSTVGAAGQSAGKHMSLDTLFVNVFMRVYMLMSYWVRISMGLKADLEF